ncbi:MAG: SDR family oxidoreductase [Salaquimonas sp.]|nr:SDR family oxidoreductase [Salaquimonas sp.]
MQRSFEILVTGASGLLGHTLAPFLRQAGHEVTTAGHSHATGVDRLFDTTDEKAVRTVLDEVWPQIVINLVGLTNVDNCEEDPQEAWRLNVKSVETLAGWVREVDDCRLIHISTDQVYGGVGPHVEDDIDIVNVYALSKYAGELAALQADATVLRTNFFGPSHLEGRPSFSDWAVATLRSGEAFTGFDDVLFSPLTMTTLSKAVERVVHAPKAGVFNLGSRGGCTKAEFIASVARAFDLDASAMRHGSQADIGLKARRPGDMRMDSALFEEAYDFKLPVTEEEISGLTHA